MAGDWWIALSLCKGRRPSGKTVAPWGTIFCLRTSSNWKGILVIEQAFSSMFVSYSQSRPELFACSKSRDIPSPQLPTVLPTVLEIYKENSQWWTAHFFRIRAFTARIKTMCTVQQDDNPTEWQFCCRVFKLSLAKLKYFWFHVKIPAMSMQNDVRKE